MIQDIRLYKRFDADLIALHAHGYPVGALTKAALVAYAANRKVKFRIEEAFSFDIGDAKTFRIRLLIKDKATIRLLQSVKRGYRNAFCKALLRETLLYQNLGVFFSSSSSVRDENGRMNDAEDCEILYLTPFARKRSASLLRDGAKKAKKGKARPVAYKDVDPETGEILEEAKETAQSKQRKAPVRPKKAEAEPEAAREVEAPKTALNEQAEPFVPAPSPSPVIASGDDLLAQFDSLLEDDI